MLTHLNGAGQPPLPDSVPNIHRLLLAIQRVTGPNRLGVSGAPIKRRGSKSSIDAVEIGMIESLDVFEERLNRLDPDDDEFELHVDELVEESSPALLELIYPAAFRFFESYPEHDCGMPGTLVHVMEEYYPNYVDELVASISRNPSTNTVWMANRILNADIDDGLRECDGSAASPTLPQRDGREHRKDEVADSGCEVQRWTLVAEKARLGL